LWVSVDPTDVQRVSIDDPEERASGVDRHGLSDPLGTTDVAVNRYRLAPEFPGGLHAHANQEEVFYVVEGEATFETLARSDADRSSGEVTVGRGEAIRFAPGEFQSGRNDSDGDLVALAIGAPRDGDDVRLPLACPECGREDVRLETGGDEPRLVCPDCGDERVPGACPDCGHEDLRVALDEGNRTVVVCRGCGAAFDDPPLRD
jgi:uncharacterized cupin superfamily protein